MYEICVECEFRAWHALRLNGGSIEQSHEHDWSVSVCVVSEELNEIGLVIDFHELGRIVEGVIVQLEGTTLNELAMFADTNPSAERVAKYVYREVAARLPQQVNMGRVTVTEAPGCSASYIEGE